MQFSEEQLLGKKKTTSEKKYIST